MKCTRSISGLGCSSRRVLAEGHDTLGIKPPFIRFASEFTEALAAVRRAGLDPGTDVKVGVSVETPAAALRLHEFLDAGAAFVSVGVSDSAAASGRARNRLLRHHLNAKPSFTIFTPGCFSVKYFRYAFIIDSGPHMKMFVPS